VKNIPEHGATGSQSISMAFCAHARAYARKDSHSHRLVVGHSQVSVKHELKNETIFIETSKTKYYFSKLALVAK